MTIVQKTIFFVAGIALLSATAKAAPFSFPTAQVDIAVASSVNHAPIKVPVTAAQDFDFAALQVQTDAAWVTPTIDAASKSLVLAFATSGLTNPSYTATITATHGAESHSFFVKASVATLNVVKIIDDPFRSRVYGVHQNALNRGAVIVFDPISAQLLGSVTTSRKPTDLAVSNDGTELFVINSVDRAITVVDLASLAVKQTIQLAAYSEWDANYTSANIKVGKGNILYYTDGAWAPALRVFDRSTQAVLQTVAVGGTNGYGCGDFSLSPDKSSLIAWVQYGWTAGWGGSYIARFSLAANGTLTAVETTSQNYPTQLERDPLDSPVFISNDGKLAFVKRLAVASNAVNETRQNFPTEVYSISDGGEIAVTNKAIFETESGNKLYDLPITTSVQAITSDYARLVYFNAQQHAFGTINLPATLGDELLGRDLAPANGSIVLSPQVLRWPSMSGAQSYRIYLGTSEQAVTAAGPGSPLLLGATNSPMLALGAALTPGTTYYWKIETLTAFETVVSEVYHFTVSEISASASEISTATVRGHSNLPYAIDLDSTVSGKSWQASSDSSWITFQSPSGITPGTLQVILNASQLTPGTHTGTIYIAGSSGGTFRYPGEVSGRCVTTDHP